MKLAEMNGFPGLLQSTLSIPEEENMFLWSSSSNVESVFMNWKHDGNCFEEGKKLQLVVGRYPEVKNSIDNALILTGVGINAFIKSVSKYMDLMLHLPLCADLVFAELLNLVDYYVYGVTTLFAPEALLNTLFVVTDGSEIYPYIVPFIRQCQHILFPKEIEENEEQESVTELVEKLTPLSQERDDNEDHEVTVIHSLISKQVDGIIFMGHHLTEKIRAEFSRTRTPIVLAGTVDLEHQLPSVNIDYKAAVEDCVTQLAKNNEKVAFVSGPLIDDINGKLRLAGYKSGLEKNNLSYNEGLVFEAKYSYKDGFELAQRVLNSGATAAYVGEDELAAGLLNGLFAAGKSVPEDFEIITSNDSPITSYTRPNLSSINHPLYDLGAVSMRMLTKIMHKEELEDKDVILNHGLTLRQSTK